MFALLKSNCKKHDCGDVIVNSETIRSINFITHDDTFMIRVVHNLVDGDGDNIVSKALYDDLEHARAALSVLLHDLGQSVESANNIAKTMAAEKYSVKDISAKILGALRQAVGE